MTKNEILREYSKAYMTYVLEHLRKNMQIINAKGIEYKNLEFFSASEGNFKPFGGNESTNKVLHKAFTSPNRAPSPRTLNIIHDAFSIELKFEDFIQKLESDPKYSIYLSCVLPENYWKSTPVPDKEVKRKFPRNKVVVGVCVVGAFILIVLFSNLKSKGDDSPDNQQLALSKIRFTVVLLPFEPLENCTYRQTKIESTICKRLTTLSYIDDLGLEIIFDSTACLRKPEDADLFARKHSADLIVWGDIYVHPEPKQLEAELSFKLMPSKRKPNETEWYGTSGIESFSSLSEIKEGKLQNDIDFIIYWIAGMEAELHGEPRKALKYFLNCTNYDDRTSSEAWTHIGQCYYDLSLADSSEFVLKKALELDSLNRNAYATYILLALKLKRDNLMAKKLHEIALKKMPEDAEIRAYYGLLLYVHFKDKEAGIKQLRQAIASDSNDAMTHGLYATLIDGKNKIEAKNHYKMSLKIDSTNVYVRASYGKFLEDHMNDKNGAMRQYEIVMNLDSGNADIQLRYAQLVMSKHGDMDLVANLCKSVLASNTENANAHQLLCHALCAKAIRTKDFGRKKEFYDEAKNHYWEAVKLDPSLKSAKSDSAFAYNL